MLSTNEHAMTEQDQTEQPANETDEASAEGGISEAKEAEESEAEESKPEKPKKVKISYEASMPRNEAVSYFEAIVGGLRSGRLEFKQDDETLVLSPPDHLDIEVKAQRKGDKAKVVFEIEWTDESRLLEILN
jgi:amphi-Trp domain-containing protein